MFNNIFSLDDLEHVFILLLVRKKHVQTHKGTLATTGWNENSRVNWIFFNFFFFFSETASDQVAIYTQTLHN